jgi:hypothetical protein
MTPKTHTTEYDTDTPYTPWWYISELETSMTETLTYTVAGMHVIDETGYEAT